LFDHTKPTFHTSNSTLFLKIDRLLLFI
jgi:hypothetical protein